jgi:hypothetical protein
MGDNSIKKTILTLFIAVSVSNLQLPILKLQNVPKKTKILIFWLDHMLDREQS